MSELTAIDRVGNALRRGPVAAVEASLVRAALDEAGRHLRDLALERSKTATLEARIIELECFQREVRARAREAVGEARDPKLVAFLVEVSR